MTGLQALRRQGYAWGRYTRLAPRWIGPPTPQFPFGYGMTRTTARQRRRSRHWLHEFHRASLAVEKSWPPLVCW